MICPKCSVANPANVQFCIHCGTPVFESDLHLHGLSHSLQTLIQSRYRLVKEIKAMHSIYYTAEDLVLGRMVFIKVLNPNIIQSRSWYFGQRFVFEAKQQTNLIHENIQCLYDVILNRDIYAIIYEFVDGMTLKEYHIKQPIDKNTILTITLQILLALNHAHNVSMVHGGVRPDNIFVSNNNRVKLRKFGFDMLENCERSGRRGITQYAKDVVYLSPEQITKPRQVDERTDIYSTGIVLYELLQGKFDYDFSVISDFELMQRIVNGDLIDLNSLECKDTDLRALIQDMIANNPSDRIVMKNLIDQINNLLNNDSIGITEIQRDEIIKKRNQEPWIGAFQEQRSIT